jgi:hypothetical protein
MKSYIIVLVTCFLINANAKGQYKVNKTQYDFRSYSYVKGDPYNPAVAGLVSCLIPGLGQMITGEGGRGVAFLGGFAGCALISLIGSSMSDNDINSGGYGTKGSGLMALGLIGMMAVDIWAIIDAIHVAKVNDLAWRAKTKSGNSLRITPHIGSLQSQKVRMGLSLKIRF